MHYAISYFEGGLASCLGEVAAGCTVCKRCSKLRTRCIFTKQQGRVPTTLVYCDDRDDDVCCGGCNDVNVEDVVGYVCPNDFDHPHVTR